MASYHQDKPGFSLAWQYHQIPNNKKMTPTKILILCTGNSCRSQMAEGFLKSFDRKLVVYSAGTSPAKAVHPMATEVMREAGIDIADAQPQHVDSYLATDFDYVITVCGGARESCPSFTGNVKHRLHIGFDDPAEARGTDEEIWSEFRRIRDEINSQFYTFYKTLTAMNIQKKDLKEVVRSKYNLIAKQSSLQNKTSCCGSTGCCDTIDYSIFSDSYTHLQGYAPEADLGLGCGLPTEFAHIEAGNTVLDLGSGAGNDCFIARSIVGENGRVIGLDFADNMLQKARENAAKLHYDNVEFIKGDIEEIPIADGIVDVVVSNCVLNLVPDKEKAFKEVYRVLKPSGHFSVSDVVLQGQLPEELVKEAEMYAGCVSGAVQKDQYLAIIEAAGFKNVKVQKEKIITIPEEILSNYLSLEQLSIFKSKNIGIFSVTVYAEK